MTDHENKELRLIKMHENYLHTMLISQSLTLDFKVYHPEELSEFRGRFFLLFIKEFDADNNKLIIDEIPSNTPELRASVSDFVLRYRYELPVVNKLNEYFSKLKEGEKFIVIPYQNLDQIEHYKATKLLQSIESGQDFDTLWKESVNNLGAILSTYEVYTFDKDTRKRIGEPDKNKRTCRFCKNERDLVTFKVNAHAISEALGNKRIYLNEECDDCNKSFGAGIENDLIAFSRIYLSFTGIKGKEGIAKTKGKNFTLSNDTQIILELESDNLTSEKIDVSNHLKCRLETNEEVSEQNIYRALCKFAISVIGSEYVPKFSNTLNWITDKLKIKTLPKIAYRIDPQRSFTHPSITVFLRKGDDKQLPILVAELRISVLRFVYIVPTFDNEETDFLLDINYEHYWSAFKRYSMENHWHFIDFSEDKKRKLVFTLNFELDNLANLFEAALSDQNDSRE